MPNDRDVEARLARLEEEVRQLRAQVEALAQRLGREETSPPGRPPAAQTAERMTPPAGTVPAVPVREPRQRRLQVRHEAWLGCLGILFLFVGLALFLTYAVQQGWVRPLFVVGVGVVVGAIMVGLGWRLTPQRHVLGPLLLGGGVAVWYLTDVAALRLYELLTPLVALGVALAVTVVAFGLSVGRATAVPATLGVLGGLAAPFLVGGERGGVTPFLAYTLIVLTGGGAVFWARRSLLLLTTMAVSGWVVLAFAAFELARASSDRVVVQVAVTVVWALVWWSPLLRLGRAAHLLSRGRLALLYAVLFLVPVGYLAVSLGMWEPDEHTAGAVMLGVAALYFAVAAVEVGARPFPALPHVAGLHGTVGWLLSRVGWVLLFTDRGTSLLLLIWMAESLLFLLVAERLHSRLARLGGNTLLALTGAGVLAHMFDEGVRPLEFSVLVDLTFVLFMAGLTWWKRPTLEGAVYEAVAHGGGLIWLAREMSVLEWKPGGITVAWAAYATVAYGAALLRRDHRLYWAALVVLALVGGKLVLVDAARLSALWRAVLFMAIGVLYIFLAFVGWRALARTAWREEV